MSNLTDTTTTAPSADEQVWRKQFAAIAAAVLPHVRTMDDGFAFIADTCQPAIARSYRLMVTVGYAKGWI